MGPTERTVARTLTALLSASGHKGDGLLREYIRYKDLVLLPGVFKELAPAREALLGGLHAQVASRRITLCISAILSAHLGEYFLHLGELLHESRRFLRSSSA